MPSSEPTSGEPVQLRMRKWDGSPHRRMTMTFLGSDEYGRWLGHEGQRIDAGTGVSLVPHDGCFFAHFNWPRLNTLYTDITTAPKFDWDGSAWVVTAVDMDLDIVMFGNTGESWIDDEDEFAEHTVVYDYPAEVVTSSRDTADTILRAVRAQDEPFGCTWQHWVNVLVDNGIGG